MYPDQVQRIRELESGQAPLTDALLYRRRTAETYLAVRYRYSTIDPAQKAAIERWVLFGGPRPWTS